MNIFTKKILESKETIKLSKLKNSCLREFVEVIEKVKELADIDDKWEPNEEEKSIEFKLPDTPDNEESFVSIYKKDEGNSCGCDIIRGAEVEPGEVEFEDLEHKVGDILTKYYPKETIGQKPEIVNESMYLIKNMRKILEDLENDLDDGIAFDERCKNELEYVIRRMGFGIINPSDFVDENDNKEFLEILKNFNDTGDEDTMYDYLRSIEKRVQSKLEKSPINESKVLNKVKKKGDKWVVVINGKEKSTKYDTKKKAIAALGSKQTN